MSGEREAVARLSDEEREALGNWLRHRGVYSFGLLVDIADCVERILAARTATAPAHDEAAAVALVAAAEVLETDEDVAFNVILGGPSYVAYWLRERAAPTAAEQVHAARAVADRDAARIAEQVRTSGEGREG